MSTIFIIEDNASLRENTKMLLELNGYEVFAFESGPPALEKFKDEIPDLVLCDIVLPGINGYEILGQIRRMPSGSEVPFIFLSALTERDHVRKGMNFGADDYLSKPFTSANLLDCIKSRLERSDRQQAVADLTSADLRVRKLKYLPHEIRTPLSAIMGGIEILRTDENKLGGSVKEVLDFMEEASKRLEKTALNYFLYLSLSAGQAPFLSTTPFEAGSVVRSLATKLAHDSGRESDLLLETVETPTHCGNCLDLIVGEVVSNAFKFSPPGSKVEVKMTKAEGRLTLNCRDHGPGMTLEEIDEIGPFKQFRRDKNEQQGLGLGLAICRTTMLASGGSITVTNTGAGACFTLTFEVVA